MTGGLTGSTPFLDYPFRIGSDGAASRTDAEDHVRDLVEQVLFTNPGERVNLPDFGCGLRNLVFAGNSDVLRATTQFLIMQNLTRWLGDVLTVEQVTVRNDEASLLIDITYALRRTRERQSLNVRV